MQGMEQQTRRQDILPKEILQAVTHRLEVLASAENNLENAVLSVLSKEMPQLSLARPVATQTCEMSVSHASNEQTPQIQTAPRHDNEAATGLEQIRRAINEIFEVPSD